MAQAENTKSRNIKLKKWISEGGTGFRDLLADLSGYTVGVMRQWTAGRRKPSAQAANKLVVAMAQIKREFPDAPNPLNRGDLCEACAQCPHFKDSLVDVDDLK